MRYKVLIEKVDDPAQAAHIAETVARWSGSTVNVVSSIITKKSICIRREADEDEVRRLRVLFEPVGATVITIPITPPDASNEDEDKLEENLEAKGDYLLMLDKFTKKFRTNRAMILVNVVLSIMMVIVFSMTNKAYKILMKESQRLTPVTITDTVLVKDTVVVNTKQYKCWKCGSVLSFDANKTARCCGLLYNVTGNGKLVGGEVSDTKVTTEESFGY